MKRMTLRHDSDQSSNASHAPKALRAIDKRRVFVVSRFWRCFRRDEQLALVAASLVLLFGAAHEYSWRRNQPPLPPFFVEVAVETPVARMGSPARWNVPSGARRITVDVAGLVKRPGVQQWAPGARVGDAIKKAGGAMPKGDVHALNLAARLQDGQQIRVVRRSEISASAAVASRSSTGETSGAPKTEGEKARSKTARSGKSPFAGIINVNTASAEELEVLPGIGPATAARIVESRTRQGRFRSLEDLDRVKGLGPKKLEALRSHLAF